MKPDNKYKHWNYHNPSSGISVFYPIPVKMWSCEIGNMPPQSIFFLHIIENDNIL